MQIRTKGTKLQCLRSKYDLEAGRSRQTIIATFPAYVDVAPLDKIDKLTEKEKIELQNWLANREVTRKEKTLKRSANPFAIIASIEYITESIEANPVTKKQADKIKVAIKAMQKALNIR